MPQDLLLGVNIDHSATVRQARYRGEARGFGGNIEPDPVALAQAAERAGADAITLHLREDRRHIQEHDVRRLRACQAVPMNLEMAATEAMLAVAEEVRPECVLLVPEGRMEVTTEGGLEVAGDLARIAEAAARMRAAGIATSLFIDADAAQIRAAREAGADAVELHTGPFAHAEGRAEVDAEVRRLIEAAHLAHDLGLQVNAGHGLNYHNLRHLLRVPHLVELNIGHSIMSRALFVGIEAAVRQMKDLMRGYALGNP